MGKLFAFERRLECNYLD